MKNVYLVELRFKYNTSCVFAEHPTNEKLIQVIKNNLIEKWKKKEENIIVKYKGLYKYGDTLIKKVFAISDGIFEDYELDVMIEELPLL